MATLHLCIWLLFPQEVEEQQQDAHEADQAAEEPDITSVPNDLNGMEAPATAFVPAAGGPGSSGAQQPGLALVDGALAQDAAAGASWQQETAGKTCIYCARCTARPAPLLRSLPLAAPGVAATHAEPDP